jgi:pimeloyl-ACP methyl ester carboxylesterase
METEKKGHNLSINVNSFDLSYDDFGDGSIPIIFLHGFPFDKSMWEGQLDFLKNSYRVIAYDIRGFGRSTDEETPLSIDLFGEDLILFMNKLNIEKAILCGLSMGGYIALNVMKRFPSHFHALILCDTQCISDTAEGKEKKYKMIDQIESNGVNDFNEDFIENVFHKDSIINKKQLVDELRTVVFSNSKHIITKGFLALTERSETCSSINKINIPTLIICGREDQVTPLIQSEFMNKNIKGSLLQILSDAGHVSNLEQPQAFNKYLGEFLNDLSGFDILNS